MPMMTWGPSLYGDPCRECGFHWSASFEQAVTLMAGLPADYGTLLEGASGAERHHDLSWTVAEYVCHVGDNLRIWAERLMGVVRGAPPEVGGYNEGELAQARNYGHIPLAAARWSLERAVDDWLGAVAASTPTGTVLVHPLRGDQTLLDVVRSNAHDAHHHRWDIERSLGGTRP